MADEILVNGFGVFNWQLERFNFFHNERSLGYKVRVKERVKQSLALAKEFGLEVGLDCSWPYLNNAEVTYITPNPPLSIALDDAKELEKICKEEARGRELSSFFPRYNIPAFNEKLNSFYVCERDEIVREDFKLPCNKDSILLQIQVRGSALRGNLETLFPGYKIEKFEPADCLYVLSSCDGKEVLNKSPYALLTLEFGFNKLNTNLEAINAEVKKYQEYAKGCVFIYNEANGINEPSLERNSITFKAIFLTDINGKQYVAQTAN